MSGELSSFVWSIIILSYWYHVIQYNLSRVTGIEDGHRPYPSYYMSIVSKVKLATEVEGDQKALFSIATTPKCRGGRYSFPRNGMVLR